MHRQRILSFILGLFLISSSWAQADLGPLIIACDDNAFPFVQKGAHNQLYGFDIEMMLTLCKILNRSCEFHPMTFDKILPALIQHEADLGIGAITITLERSKEVDFSIPYLLSYAQFLALPKWEKTPFSFERLKNKKIGIQKGTIFQEALIKQGITESTIVEYRIFTSLIQALKDGSIDFALMDANVALYWQELSNANMVTFGEKFLYGYGFGIAVSQNNPSLLEQINSAVLEFQNNGSFQKVYGTYINSF